MTYDVLRGTVLLFGGYGQLGNLADTWEWDGTSWMQRSPVTSPPGRHQHTLAPYPPRIVMFGGYGNAPLGDTWEWDGSTWRQLTPATSPSARTKHAMAYDAARRRIVLFGGSDASRDLADTWEWDGATWTQRTPTTSPPARRYHAMVYEAARQRVVLFGGSAGGLLGDTWDWDGATWTQRIGQGPSARESHDMVYDSLRNRIVLFGGADATGNRSDTWEGPGWIQRQPSTSPTARVWHRMAFDSRRGRTVLFAGWTTNRLNDTWEYATQSPASYAPFGNGCRGSAGTPTLAPAQGELPWIGEKLDVQLTSLPTNAAVLLMLGASKTVWGPITLPLDLQVAGMPGCLLHVSPDVFGALASSGGAATWTLSLPNDTGLVGVLFYNQGFVHDPPANRLGATVTNGGEGKIGAK